MRHSIRIKLVLILTVLLLSSIFVCWFINNQFLASYYEKYKIDTCEKLYYSIVEEIKTYKENNDYESFELAIDQLEENKNVTINIFSAYLNPSTDIFFEHYYPNVDTINKQQQEQLKDRVKKYIYDTLGTNNKTKHLKKTANFDLFKVFDDRIQSNYIELYGSEDSGINIYIRSNYEEIKDSVAISNRFLGYVGIVVTLIGVIVTFFVSNSFARPILELSNVAKSMTNLNFNVKYKEKRQDEIGILGDSINHLSEQLENTISELKTANNELQKDIANKIQIDEMRTEFLSNVTHELKTPIALIQGYAEGLQLDINDGDAQSREFYCEVIMDEAAKMNTMVKKLLSLNQIESGNNLVSFERFDLVELIQSVLNATNILFQQKGIQVEFNPEVPVYVWGDEYMVEEVVTNYISNAVNHCKDPNIIEVCIRKEEKVVHVSVFNTGDPIPQEDINNVWVKFYKVDKARTREYGGNGIGLSIVKAIMDAHNQHYGVNNRDNGVEFWFELDCNSDTKETGVM